MCVGGGISDWDSYRKKNRLKMIEKTMKLKILQSIYIFETTNNLLTN
jgi:hypothetical protein